MDILRRDHAAESSVKAAEEPDLHRSEAIPAGTDSAREDSTSLMPEREPEVAPVTWRQIFLGYGLLIMLGRWVWDAEDTYSKTDPRRWVVNKKTERFKKVALILAGIFSVLEVLQLIAGTPRLYYCPRRCSQGNDLFKMFYERTDDSYKGLNLFPCKLDPTSEAEDYNPNALAKNVRYGFVGVQD
jgi:hypothetical protein